MANVTITGSNVGSSLSALLMSDDIEPGSEPGYQTCKILYLYHPVGAKLAESPVKMAQFLPREITIKTGPEETLRKAFLDQWGEDECTKRIRRDRKSVV